MKFSALIFSVFLFGCDSPETLQSETPIQEVNIEQVSTSEPPQLNTSPSKEPSELASLTSGSYEEYSPERFKELLGSEKFILFFHADWCPTCRALEKEIKESLEKLNSRTVLEVNYDTETDLKKKYGITVQSTLVFIDSDGEVFEKRVNPDLELIEKFFY